MIILRVLLTLGLTFIVLAALFVELGKAVRNWWARMKGSGGAVKTELRRRPSQAMEQARQEEREIQQTKTIRARNSESFDE